MDVQEVLSSAPAQVSPPLPRSIVVILYNTQRGVLLAKRERGDGPSFWDVPRGVVEQGIPLCATIATIIAEYAGIAHDGAFTKYFDMESEGERCAVVVCATAISACRARSTQVTEVSWARNVDEFLAQLDHVSREKRTMLECALLRSIWPSSPPRAR